ncbi:hypothetical protein RSOL_350540 [Rhizoctonia solani AG-3 Rhs1AP]|uniref:Uncharacterized protein n=1 Tax=Rhizoctonia solani AG-3 Rhs1AP TaxID=1086054 RepID=X8JB82_9AGAM|nr:hypothetical protein RSOL_350540 [Rhizoctonia solani AG-3 Rhs1AP]
MQELIAVFAFPYPCILTVVRYWTMPLRLGQEHYCGNTSYMCHWSFLCFLRLVKYRGKLCKTFPLYYDHLKGATIGF